MSWEDSSTGFQQAEVSFYDDTMVSLYDMRSGVIWLVLDYACQNLGISNVGGQVNKLREDATFQGFLMKLNIDVHEESRCRQQAMWCLRHTMVPLWLAGISVKRVSPAVQEKLTRYKLESAKVLDEYWQGGGVLIREDKNAWDAIIAMAEEGKRLAGRVDEHTGILHEHSKQLVRLQTRLNKSQKASVLKEVKDWQRKCLSPSEATEFLTRYSLGHCQNPKCGVKFNEFYQGNHPHDRIIDEIWRVSDGGRRIYINIQHLCRQCSDAKERYHDKIFKRYGYCIGCRNGHCEWDFRSGPQKAEAEALHEKFVAYHVQLELEKTAQRYFGCCFLPPKRREET